MIDIKSKTKVYDPKVISPGSNSNYSGANKHMLFQTRRPSF